MNQEPTRLFETIDIQFVAAIHYGCDKFQERSQEPPAVRQIAIAKGNGDVLVFESSPELSSDDAERSVLKKLSDYLPSIREQPTWLHWNMRERKYGFEAIEERCRLHGIEVRFSSNRIDLSFEFWNKFGTGYIDDPKLPKLMELNKLRLDLEPVYRMENIKQKACGIRDLFVLYRCGRLHVSSNEQRRSKHQSSVSVDVQNRTITLQGRTYCNIPEDACYWFSVLVKRPGEWLGIRDFKDDPLIDDPRSNRLKNKLPREVADCIESKSGAGVKFIPPNFGVVPPE